MTLDLGSLALRSVVGLLLCFLLAHLLFMVSPVHAAMVGSDWSTTRSHGPSEEYPRGQ